MNAKSLVTVGLLMFVGVSVVYVVVREAGQPAPEGPVTATDPSNDPKVEPVVTAGDESSGTKVLVYYFHRTQRCVTCRTIEAYARDAIREGFPDEYQAGVIEWHALNVEEPANSHFVDDYRLAFSSLVIARMEGGRQTRWDNLEDVWKLVHQSKAGFFEYVQRAVAGYLGE